MKAVVVYMPSLPLLAVLPWFVHDYAAFLSLNFLSGVNTVDQYALLLSKQLLEGK
jgi:hypothetical protein